MNARTTATVAGPSATRMKATAAALAARELAGRRVGTPGGAAARTWLTTALTELDAVIDVDRFDTAAGSAANLYGAVDPAASGQADIWLTAHYDGVGDIDGRHRPGAADNAAGVAVVLEAARHLKGRLPAASACPCPCWTARRSARSGRPGTPNGWPPKAGRHW